MNKHCIVTTSWDDGHVLDILLAKLLKKYAIAGTLYVCPFDREFQKKDLLTDRQILLLSKDFEIGAHTITHPHLTKIPLQEAEEEIRRSKTYLEKIIHTPVISFCYPGGYHNNKVQKLVQDAGFRLGRTVERHAFDAGSNPFAVPTTFHTYNHFSDIHKIIKFAVIASPQAGRQTSQPRSTVAWRFRPDSSTSNGIASFLAMTNRLHRYTDWEYLAMDMFDVCLKERRLFHLFGHSWELEKFGWWEKLERVLQHISGRKNVRYVTNGEIPL